MSSADRESTSSAAVAPIRSTPAFWHTVLVRYVDFMDNFLAPTETCHTADNFGVALTAAELAGGSGRDLMLGVAIGYTVQSRLVDHGNFMTRGFDHTAQLAFSHNAAAGRLLSMSEAQIANAIAMAASSDASFAVIRAADTVEGAGVRAVGARRHERPVPGPARRGGPLNVVEGPNGIDDLLHMQLRVDWDHEGYEGVTQSTIKKYNAQIHTQSTIQCMIELVAANNPAWTSPPGSTKYGRLHRGRRAADHLRLHRWWPLRDRDPCDDQRTGRPRSALSARRCVAGRPSHARSVHYRADHQAGRTVTHHKGVGPPGRLIHRRVPAPDAGQKSPCA